MLAHAELVSIKRSAAMLAPRAQVQVLREDLLEILEEVLDRRELINRVAGGLADVAAAAATAHQP